MTGDADNSPEKPRSRCPEMSDPELVAAIQNLQQGAVEGTSLFERSANSRLALEELIQRNYDWITRFCLAEFRNEAAAKDCVQEIMIQIACSIQNFRGQSALSTWIFTIVKRIVLKERKKQRKRQQQFIIGRDMDIGEAGGEIEQASARSGELAGQARPDILFFRDQKKMAILGVIDTLPDKQRHAVLLHYFEDLSVEEAAERIGCAVASLKTHLFRARKKLAQMLKAEQLFTEDN